MGSYVQSMKERFQRNRSYKRVGLWSGWSLIRVVFRQGFPCLILTDIRIFQLTLHLAIWFYRVLCLVMTDICIFQLTSHLAIWFYRVPCLTLTDIRIFQLTLPLAIWFLLCFVRSVEPFGRRTVARLNVPLWHVHAWWMYYVPSLHSYGCISLWLMTRNTHFRNL